MVHDPALAAGVVVGAPVSPPGMGPGVGAQPGPQPSVGIIRSLRGRGVALGGSVLPDQPTRTPFADVEDSTQVNNGRASAGRAQNSPLATSRSMSLSSSASASTCLSR